MTPAHRTVLSLRRTLLAGILLPVLAFVVINAIAQYRQTLAALNVAYDRTLLASAKAMGEHLTVEGYDDQARFRPELPYAALEAFEADTETRMVFRIATLAGATVSGYDDLPRWQGRVPDRGPYAALVDFYDEQYRGEAVRVAALLQPVASERGRGMVVIQVAETLELRRTMARRVLIDQLWRQAALVMVIAALVVWVVQRATRPVRRISQQMRQRADGDLTPLDAPDAPRELRPLIGAMNTVMQRLSSLLAHQKRFVRDASHQLRTPLAVLKTQVQSARRGDLPAHVALAEIDQTVDRATRLANQMLALAKVEQLRQQPGEEAADLADVAREVALDLAPLVADGDLDFSIETETAVVSGHAWMLRELVRNLMHNAIAHSRRGGALSVTVARRGGGVELMVRDSGPGLDPAVRDRLFQPFATRHGRGGSGLGLAICHEIALALGGRITLDDRVDSDGQVIGLDAVVRLPAATGGPPMA